MRRIKVGTRVELTMDYGHIKAGVLGTVVGRHWIYAKVKLDGVPFIVSIPARRFKELS